MKNNFDLVTLLDNASRQIGLVNRVVDAVVSRIVPSTVAKACHGGGAYCSTSRGSFCHYTACDTCIACVKYKFPIYNETVNYGAGCASSCTNSCVWTGEKVSCGTCPC